MKKIIYLLFVFITLFTISFNCTTPNSSGGGGGGGSDEKHEENVNNNKITGLQTNILQSNIHIRLEWGLVDNSKYNIYRYNFQSDAIPDLIIQNHNTNEYEDNSAIIDTPYYYKVSSVKNGTEGELSNFVFGLKSSVVDNFENNNNLIDFQNNDAGLPLDIEHDVILYSCKKDNNGGIETDNDWYKYRGKAEYFKVAVTLGDTGFDNDDIKLQFRYESSDNNIIEKLFPINDNDTTVCGFGNVNDYDNDAGNVPVNVYFRIYIDENNVDKIKNIIEGYKLKVSTGI